MLPFSWTKVSSNNKLADYSLLLGCVTFLLLEGYLQFQYKIFGTQYGLALAIPTIIFFYCAYRFDHAGVLSMAITALASWCGLTIAPLSVLSANNFSNTAIIHTAIILGIVLVVLSKVSTHQQLKEHFCFTYLLLGANLAMAGALTGLFGDHYPVLYFIIATSLAIYLIIQARSSQSALFLLMGVIYGYIILTYSVFKISPEDLTGILAIWYFLLSSIGVLFFLLNFKKILRIKK